MSEAELSFDEEFVCTKLAKVSIRYEVNVVKLLLQYHSLHKDPLDQHECCILTESLRLMTFKEDYLDTIPQFCAIGLIDSTEYVFNKFNQKIYYTQHPFQSIDTNVQSVVTSSKSYKFLDLAEKINNNSDLFTQLEFLMRKIPVTDTKNVDLKLITQNLLRQHNILINEERTLDCINIKDETPLFQLGLFACKTNEDIVTICCTKVTVAVCTLFVQLCREANLGNEVRLAITKNSFPPYTIALPQWHAGCVGVISATSDVDSAVDSFLSATTRYPWKLKKIYVQEPAIERFREAMKWKQTLHSLEPVDARFRYSSAAAYSLRGQIFLDEYVGSESFVCPNVVSIEVFRTVKELVSLVNPMNPFAISIWCSDIAESNEIANEVLAGVVWINDHGSFDGPPLVSAPIYDTDTSQDALIPDLHKIVSEPSTLKVLEAWQKLEPTQRMLKIHEVFAKWQKSFSFKYFDEISFGCDVTVDVDRKLCIITRKAVDAVFVSYNNFCDYYPRYLKYIAEGGVVILFSSLIEPTVIELFLESEVPIFVSISNDRHQTQMYRTKVIWTSVGTTFAN